MSRRADVERSGMVFPDNLHNNDVGHGDRRAVSRRLESKLQTQIIRWLKDQGAYVIKPKPGPGVPVGCPDILFLFKNRWGAIECKADERAKMQPGQAATLDFLRGYNTFVYKVFPENWPEIKSLLSSCFF